MSADLTWSHFQQVCEEVFKNLQDVVCEDDFAKVRKEEIEESIQILMRKKQRKGVFNPDSQADSLNLLRRRLDQKTLRVASVRRICWEYWRALRSQTVDLASSLSIALGAYVATGSSIGSRVSEDYPLHRAVFEGRLYCIRNLCLHESDSHIFCEVDSPDPLGHSPLMLAVKLRKLEEALVLVDHGANPKYRSSVDQPTPLEQASGMKDKAMSRVLLAACQRLQLGKWEAQKSKVAAALLQLPNFELKMRWECKSKFLPFVKRWTPSDSYVIYKQGEELRCDMTLVGWNHFKAERGQVSLLFRGREGRVFLVDRETQGVKELLQSPNEKLIDVQLNQLLRYQRAAREIRSANVDLIPMTDWKGDVVSKKIGAWTCQQFKAKCNIDLNLDKRAITLDERLMSMSSFEEYFKYCVLPQTKSRVPSANSSVVTVSPRSSRKVSKSLTAELWLSQEFPLRLEHFLPLLGFLGSISKKAKTLKTVLGHLTALGNGGFPVKARVPLLMTLKAHVLFEHLRIGNLDPQLFSVPESASHSPDFSHPEVLISINEYPEVNEEDIFQEPPLDSSSRSTAKHGVERNLDCSQTVEEEKDECLPGARDRYLLIDEEDDQTTGEENLDDTSEMQPNHPRETCNVPVTARGFLHHQDVPMLTKQQVLTTLRLTARTARRTKDVDIMLL